MLDELVDEEQPVLEHLLEDEDRPLRLRRDRERDRRQVGGKRRPRAVLDLRDLAAEVVLRSELLTGRNVHARPVDLDAHAEPREVRQDRDRGPPASASSIQRSPPVTAASPMKLATSMCSGAIRYSPPPSRSTPRMRSTFDSMPSICAPSETRNRQRSWTCGSHAALPITVSPSASTAAMTAFSVPITLASSRKTCLPASRSARNSNARSIVERRAELLERVDVRRRAGGVRSRRRRAAGATRGRSARSAGRRRGTTRGCAMRALGSTSVFDTPRASIRTSFGAEPLVSAPRSSSSSTIVSTSRIRGTFASVTGSPASSVAARIGSAPFLFPADADAAVQRAVRPRSRTTRSRASW